ncbi:MAG: 5-formyltetrahydrofolate cyclo-ligase [Desulfobulbaceae bacterium]|nr:5-formyltetrahydrofolate cyclo-ligase [Desulfobulbaceae bacterium]
MTAHYSGPLQTRRQTLRRHILALRNRLEPAEIVARSNSLTRNLWQVKAFSVAKLPFVYVDFRSEVRTIPIIQACLEKGKRVTVPLTIENPPGLRAYVVSDIEQDLTPGFRSILEPDPERTEAVDPSEIDAVVMPGSVFDLKGNRLGYGGGYYDRFLEKDAPQAVRIAIAFDLQVVEEVPALPHDQQLDFIVTESRVIRITDRG